MSDPTDPPAGMLDYSSDTGSPADDLRVEVSATSAREARTPSAGGRSPLDARLTARGRAVRLVAGGSALLLLLVGILSVSAPARAGLSAYIGGFVPTPTPTLVPGTDLFYLLPSPPGTTVLLDGHPLARLAYPGDPQPLRFARGHHTLTWRSSAFPFRPLSCTLTVPDLFRAPTDTCPYLTAQDLPAPLNRQPDDPTVIGLHVTADNLAPDQAAALTSAIRAALATLRSSTTVQPGERYFFATPGQSGGPVAATEPLRATLSVVPFTEDLANPCLFALSAFSPCRFPGQNCARICTLPTPAGSGSAVRVWLASTQVHLSWTYASATGRVVASDIGENGFGVQDILLRISWDGDHWQVAPIVGHQPNLAAADDLLCEPAAEWFGQSPVNYIEYPDAANALAFSDASGTQLTDGCVLRIAATGASTVPGITPDSPALFIERFGVLLAASAAAHTLWPDLPRADATAQALADRLAASLAG